MQGLLAYILVLTGKLRLVLTASVSRAALLFSVVGSNIQRLFLHR